MNLVIKLSLQFLLTLSCSILLGQEICDDGIDNDNDGLIDINDTEDCNCETLMPSSLIPNPSFEEMSCCPDNEGELECANSWIQASEPTTDYVHTCGVLGNPFLGFVAPLPFPDGNGGVGFRDGKPSSSQFKEYVGSCLTETMEAGVNYRLDFFVGFHEEPSSRFLPMAFFGTDDCNNLPFGVNNQDFGCPTNGPGWDLLGEIDVNGNNEWVNVIFDFTADKNYEAIVLGPGCAAHPDFRDDPYFYIDRLALAEQSEFSVPLANISGEPCDDSLILEAEQGQLSYQWYLDGVAIIGETSTSLSITSTSEEGEYVVRIESQDGCFLSESYDLLFPEDETFNAIEICEGDIYPLGQQLLSVSGSYTDTISLGIGCDSISNIELIVYPSSESMITEIICLGDTIQIAAQVFSQEGEYNIITENTNGCDSTININLIIEAPIEDLSIDSIININLGDSITLSPTSASNDIVIYEWYDQTEIISTESSVTVSPFNDIEYLIIAYSAIGCSIEKHVKVIVDRNDDIYIPNVFSTSLITNKTFTIGTGSSIVNINSLLIYDRWGNMVHSYSGLISEYDGWNGTFGSALAEIGVYTYIVKLGLINNEEILKTGNITLIR